LIMKDTFAKFLSDEFPPKYVFCVYNDEVFSIELSQLNSYVMKYMFSSIDPYYNLPTLVDYQS